MIIELRRGGIVYMNEDIFNMFSVEFAKAVYLKEAKLGQYAAEGQKMVGMLRRNVEHTNSSYDFVNIAVCSSDDSNNLCFQGNVEIHGWRFV